MAEYLKIPEVARRLDVSEKTARRYVKTGLLPSTFVGGAYRVSEADLAKFLRQAQVQPSGGGPRAARTATAPGEALVQLARSLNLEPDPEFVEAATIPDERIRQLYEAGYVRLLLIERRQAAGDRDDPSFYRELDELERHLMALSRAVGGLPEGADKTRLSERVEAMLRSGAGVLERQAEHLEERQQGLRRAGEALVGAGGAP